MQVGMLSIEGEWDEDDDLDFMYNDEYIESLTREEVKDLRDHLSMVLCQPKKLPKEPDDG